MAALIRRGLVEEGHQADVAAMGEDALWMAHAHPYDVIVIDVMLPAMNGFEVCRRLRNEGVWNPVLLLTARDAVEDRVKGLDSGADDSLGRSTRTSAHEPKTSPRSWCTAGRSGPWPDGSSSPVSPSRSCSMTVDGSSTRPRQSRAVRCSTGQKLHITAT